MPFAGYKDFKDCVSKNQDKENPEAYCASIQQKVEGETSVNEVLMQLNAELADGNILRDAQLMPLGKWNHPKGPIEITFEKAQKLAEQFKKGVAGQQLPIFYVHSDKSNLASPLYGKAAGWFLDVRADPQRGVVTDIQFTEDGAKAVRNGEYRYLSAEYYDKVRLPHHDTIQEDVIVGASLVNRPHLKGMDPILNEETGHQFIQVAEEDPSKGGGPVDPILLQLCEAAKISLSEDQTELTEEQRTALTEFLDKRDKELTDAKAENADLQKQLSEEGKEKQKLRTLREAGFEEEAKLLEEVRIERFERQLSEYLPEGQELTKVARDAAKDYAKNRSEEKLTALHEVLLSGKGVAQTKPLGSSGPGNEGDNEPADVAAKFMEETNKISQERKIDLAEAMLAVQNEQPKLWNEYQEEIGAPWAKVEVN